MKNSDLVKSWNEDIMSGKFSSYNELTADDFTFSGITPEPIGKEAYKNMIQGMLSAFPDLANHLQITEEWKETVKGNLQMTGTHKNNFDVSAMGMGIIAPTGKAFRLPIENISVTCRNGKVVNFHAAKAVGGGFEGIMSQLGVTVNLM